MTHPFLRSLPVGMESLVELSLDLRWTWSHAADRLWQEIDPAVWERTGNPWLLLQSVSQRRLEQLAQERDFRAELERLLQARRDYLTGAEWFGDAHPDNDTLIAYFSMEYGLAEALPLYSGGLGVLAGDHLKAASDLGVPLVAVGLLYQEGYFRQMLDARGRQIEVYPYNTPTSLPITPVRDGNGGWLGVPLQLPGRVLVLRVWQVQVGRVALFLLDSNDPMNSPADRGITGKLYGGGVEVRLMQEIVLGIGGWRALEALGLRPDVCHLNEGHAALVTLERARRFMLDNSVDFWAALWATRAGNVFTTHTPVAAAFDVFPRTLLEEYGTHYAEQLGVSPRDLLALGSRPPDGGDGAFNMAYLAMRTCDSVNGVSRLHGAVSRRIFHDLFPRWPEREVPVGHITNGVHVPSWDSPWADEIWTAACGKGRWLGTPEILSGAIQDLGDEALWQFRGEERHELVHYARRRLARQLGQRGANPEAIAQAGNILDPNMLTLGFARRFTEYKRPNLLLHDPERLVRLLRGPSHPVQLIVAGKAHPQDEEGKRFIQAWAEFVNRMDVRAHVVFLEDYDLDLAQELVQGVDVWINTPRRPWEASGTSGMKVLVNGGLNLSELDGWWAEAYAPEVGWALGDGREHTEPGWDDVEAEQLYRLLEQEIVPLFYRRDEQGIPREWVARIRASMSGLAPRFSSNRMLQEYVGDAYLPVSAAYRRRSADGGRLAKELAAWESNLRRYWHEIHLSNLEVLQQPDGWLFALQVYLGEIPPQSVQVQLYAEPADKDAAVPQVMECRASIPGATHGYVYHCHIATARPAADFTPRIVAWHPEAHIPMESNLIRWFPG
ncbi:MAG: alpha-glucan family phosphorylase [Gammaproteobacteria bacterium]|nr:alpha-glucan family phosphorylase [Gammaproteobacteria bacterium]